MLSKNAFVNLAPHHLVTEALYKMTADRPFKFLGGDKNLNNKNEITYCSLYNKHVKQYEDGKNTDH